jgi:hypothetical protein
MDSQIILVAAVVYFVSVAMAYFLTKRSSDKKIQHFKSLREAIKETLEKKKKSDVILAAVTEKLETAKASYRHIDSQTKDLQELRANAGSITKQLEIDSGKLRDISAKIEDGQGALTKKESDLQEVMSKIDLYSRVDEFVEYGHFENPDYLYETSERFAAEIKLMRDRQKELIKDSSAFVQEGEVSLTGDKKIDKKIIDGQMKMIMRTFNIEADQLIGKVSPSNMDRTLGRIEKLANDLEKLVASLRCGISIEYVTSKYEECGIQYQYTLKKRDEQEEQKLIREQMREEARAEKDYRDALAAAEKEERMYEGLLEKAREELTKVNDEERAIALIKIAELESQLAEAQAKEERAKSLAQQTRRGHVYVISNVGSFGENVYKIGMTRRLDPMDRVKELGDASVPFSFDVHAIIFTDDAPALETALHREFSHFRVNAVNVRKEFFRVNLGKIRDAVDRLGDDEVEFRTTIAAEEYYETLRLRERSAA